MTIRRLVLTGLTAAMMAGPVLADHSDAPRTGQGGKGGMPEKMAKRLELTADQQARIKKLHEAHGPVMRAKHESQQALFKELRELVKTKAADAALTAKLDALKKGRLDIETTMHAHQDAVAAILTPMQKAKFVLWMKKKMKDGGHWKAGKDGKDKHEAHDRKDGDDD